MEDLKKKYENDKESIKDIKETQKEREKQSENEKKEDTSSNIKEEVSDKDIKIRHHHTDNGKIDRNNNGKISLKEIDLAIDEYKSGSSTISKEEITEAIDQFLESGGKISQKRLDELYKKLAEDESEGKEVELGFVDNFDFGIKYIVVGGFKNIADAKKYQNILTREYSLGTQIVENVEQSMFLVFTEKSKVTLDFDKKMKKLEELDEKKIFVDKPWIYQRKL